MRRPAPVPELRACPCGTSQPPQCVNPKPWLTKNHLRAMRCPGCGRTSASASELRHVLVAAWNELVAAELGEPRPGREGWTDITVTKFDESGLHWKIGTGTVGPIWVSKMSGLAALEYGAIGAPLTLSIDVDHARKLGLMPKEAA